MSLIHIALPMPATLHEAVSTMRSMAKWNITYHFDDDAIECLAENYVGRTGGPAPLTVAEARYVQKVVDRMRLLCDTKGIDVFDLLMTAECELDRGVDDHVPSPEVKELFS